MKKDDKILLVVIMMILFFAFPALFIIALLGLAFYLKYKDKYKLKEKVTKFSDKYVKNKDKTSNYDVIDTSAEVIDSIVLQEDEWKATKEYKR